jgi:OOP family OmpA-OmpF porin
MLKVRNVALAVALALPSAAMAQGMSNFMQDSHWYVGGGIGQSTVDINEDLGPGVSMDDKDTSFRIFGGYQFNKNFGVEFGYADLGSAKATDGIDTVTWDAKAWDLMAVGTLPLGDGKFSLIGKLGFYKGDLDASDSTGGSASESTTDFTFAIGAGYDFNKNLGIRAEWQQYKGMGKQDTTGEADVDVFSINVVYRFR